MRRYHTLWLCQALPDRRVKLDLSPALVVLDGTDDTSILNCRIDQIHELCDICTTLSKLLSRPVGARSNDWCMPIDELLQDLSLTARCVRRFRLPVRAVVPDSSWLVSQANHPFQGKSVRLPR